MQRTIWIKSTYLFKNIQQAKNRNNIYQFQQCHSSPISCSGENFLSKLINSIKSDFDKDKEMKDNIKKFRQEAQKLEETDTMKKMREKYDSIEKETFKSSYKIIENMKEAKEKLNEKIDTMSDAETFRSAKENVKIAGGKILETKEMLSNAKVIQSISEKVKDVKSTIDSETFGEQDLMYDAPKKLRMREIEKKEMNPEDIEADTETQNVTLHKDSKWSNSWENFKDNNVYVNKLFDLKTRYDESDNALIRVSRYLTDRIQLASSGLISSTELSKVVTHICTVDPNFSLEIFQKSLQQDFIPNILEAFRQTNEEVLRDWCTDAPYAAFTHRLKEFKEQQLLMDIKILDIDDLQILGGKLTDQGPIILFNFVSQEIHCIRSKDGKLKDGDPEKVLRVNQTWAMCRDMDVFDPNAAWRVIELHQSQSDQYI
ncbi:hypothetical protein SNEBB_010296 [Seison nebaliae]|nr:hypothetical protein SNEBB_010296 [Seison nebaliae]